MSELKEVRESIKEMTERTTRVETMLECMIGGVSDLTAAVKTNLESNNELKTKIVSLEARAIDKLNLVEDTVNELNTKHSELTVRVQALELINAQEAGRNESDEKHQKKWYDGWARIISIATVFIAAMSLVLQYLKSSGAS